MKLLLDENLSWRMVAVLKQHFEDCLHVNTIGLTIPAKDFEIWNYAKENNLTIVTNDEDFVDFVNVKGFPPKVILLRTGNQNQLFISNLLIQRKGDIQLLNDSDETGLLEIFNIEKPE
jgi:predicted nuclease of predicted toxin-antitoxin system